MNFKIIKWCGERKIVTHIHGFEEAYQEYINTVNYDTVQVYANDILLAQKECLLFQTVQLAS